MKVIEINNKVVNIPEGQHEFTLKQYKKTNNITDSLEILAAILNEDIEWIKKIPLAISASIIKECSQFQDTPIETGNFDFKLTLDGKLYKIDFENITLGQQADIEMLQKDIINNLNTMIAIMIRPAEIDYNIYDYKSIAELIDEVSILKIREILDFFLLMRILLEKDSQISILPQVEELIRKTQTLSSVL